VWFCTPWRTPIASFVQAMMLWVQLPPRLLRPTMHMHEQRRGNGWDTPDALAPLIRDIPSPSLLVICLNNSFIVNGNDTDHPSFSRGFRSSFTGMSYPLTTWGIGEEISARRASFRVHLSASAGKISPP
ncbi:unnamed protein product, partial [Ectocarpus sp. 13 AM-2016]